MKQIELSFIIVNYKLQNELIDCVSSIYDLKTKINFEIIIIDNSPNDNVSEIIKRKFPKVICIKSIKNGGYGSGNNIGASISKGKYLFILNPDTQIKSGSFDNFLKFYKSQNKIGSLAPILLGKDGKPYQQGTEILNPKKALFVLTFINKYFTKNKISQNYWNLNWDRNSLKEVDVVPGTAFLISKEIFEKVGGFDEIFFLYFEEFDLCFRLKKKGYRNFISPLLKINHLWGASTIKYNNSNKEFKKSRFYYFKKNFGIINALMVEGVLRINKNLIFIFISILIIAFILGLTI